MELSQQARGREGPLTFEKVWEMFQETDRKMQETDRQMKETDRKMQETDRQMQETDRKMQEAAREIEETGRLVKELTKNMGNVTNRMGDIVEHLVASGILSRFKELGYTFDKMSRNCLVIAPDGEKREVDMELHNGEDIMLIEIKAKPNEVDVDDHIERIGFLRNLNKYPDRNVYGAIAGAVFSENTKRYAIKKGFFVIEQSGDTMRIETLGGTFKPKKW